MNELNEFTYTLKREQLDVILRHLDAGQHNQVRPLIDFLLQEANRQMAEFQNSLQSKKMPMDATPETVQ